MDSASPAAAARWARAVAVGVSLGFAFGGYIGIVDAEQGGKAVPSALLTALVLLHLRNCIRWSDEEPARGWPWTLGVQAVLTAAGMVWYASTWYGNSGFLAAALLLLIRRRWAAWGGFAVVIAAQFAAALPVRPTAAEAAYLAVGHTAFVGIGLYGVARLADLIAEMRRTRDALALAEVSRERLVFAQQLNERVGVSLGRLVRGGDAADPAAVRRRLDVARAALNETRSVAHGYGRERLAGAAVADHLTATGAAVLGAVTVCLMIVPAQVRQFLRIDLTALETAVYFAALAGFVLLFLRACAPARRPLWTLAVLVPALGPLLMFDLAVWHVVYFLPGPVLVVVRGWARWATAVPLICLDPLLMIWDAELGDPTPLGMAYEVVWSAERALLVCGLVRMGEVALRVKEARAELARAAVARERLRFATDLHDLLGLGLSVVVLKSELALRLLDRDPGRASAELAEGLEAARRALADMEDVVAGRGEIALAAEAESTRAALSAAGIEVTGRVEPVALPAETDTLLATVLREGVTNVLRHSDAERCELAVEVTGRSVRLRLANDGVTGRGGTPGVGLRNLTRRARELGGTLTAGKDGDVFRLVAEVPLQPALIGRDADRVDAVPGVQLEDGRRQVVADGAPAQ
ncbi:two-component system, NarL family, sensor histidine kinase DesK [Actinomadura meyerae]|uniref:Two-component system, NarL family, sensor histidine kinase DesK n=1 Tax=Actinomadura meyerae TaxID=240840 RepID=A0A239KZ20_9ACTN|nr:histidine kinase [Actinomadura meyerae]SNT23300.1 two-component system, NarL family, sensor histidine kinase DesK [Actinomadura meyerae]